MRKIKVGLVCSIVTPYLLPVLNDLAKFKNLDIEVLYMAPTAGNRIWDPKLFESQMQFQYTFLKGYKIQFRLKHEYAQYIINPEILKVLKNRKFDLVILYGWLDFSCQAVALMSHFGGTPYVLWSDSTENERSWIRTITTLFVRWFVSGARAYIAGSTRAKAYFMRLGAKEQKVFIGANTIDNTAFKKGITAKLTQKMREEMGVEEKRKTILFVGQFIKRKNITTLLKAYQRIQDKTTNLVLIGHGEEMSRYQEQITSYCLQNVKIIARLLSREELATCYAIADVFVLPSLEETWGMVVNEAMAVGTPVVVSEAVGCADDLIVEGKTGYTFITTDDVDLAKKIGVVLRKPGLMRNSVISHINSYTAKETARRYNDAIMYAARKN